MSSYSLCLRPASENSVLHTVTIKIITLQILIIKIWIIYNFTAQRICYYNKIILSLLCQIITVILLAERHPQKYGKKRKSYLGQDTALQKLLFNDCCTGYFCHITSAMWLTDCVRLLTRDVWHLQVVLALREVTSGLDNVQDMLLYCSFCNSDFTMAVLKNIMVSPGRHTASPSPGYSSLLLPAFSTILLTD